MAISEAAYTGRLRTTRNLLAMEFWVYKSFHLNFGETPLSCGVIKDGEVGSGLAIPTQPASHHHPNQADGFYERFIAAGVIVRPLFSVACSRPAKHHGAQKKDVKAHQPTRLDSLFQPKNPANLPDSWVLRHLLSTSQKGQVASGTHQDSADWRRCQKDYCVMGNPGKEKRQERSAKRIIENDHPLIKAGFIHESQLRELWLFSDSYFRDWLRENRVPHRLISKERWFHTKQLEAWFMNHYPPNDEDDEADTSSNCENET